MPVLEHGISKSYFWLMKRSLRNEQTKFHEILHAGMEKGSVSKPSCQTNWQHFKPIHFPLPPWSLWDITIKTKGIFPMTALQSQTGLLKACYWRKQPVEDFSHRPWGLRLRKVLSQVITYATNSSKSPQEIKNKMKQCNMLGRINFAKSPGIILESDEAAASRQGEVHSVIEAWKKHRSFRPKCFSESWIIIEQINE